MLGRKGVVTLTSIGNADQMTAITAAAPDLISMFSFAEGNRYADFQLATDAVSAFTVPALVTGIAPAAAQAIAQTPTSSGDSQTSFGGLAGLFPWIAVGLIVLAGAGYMFMRRRRDPNLAPEGE